MTGTDCGLKFTLLTLERTPGLRAVPIMKPLSTEYIFHFRAHGSSPHLFTLSLAGEQSLLVLRAGSLSLLVSPPNLLQLQPNKVRRQQ